MRELPIRASHPLHDVRVEIVDGISNEIDTVAASADPRHAFLRSAWFLGSEASESRTLIARRADGSAIAALPTARLGPRLARMRAVPGTYWPYRSFPMAADTSDDELTALLNSSEAKSVLGPMWRLGPVYADDATAARLTPAATRAGWAVLSRTVATSFVLDIDALQSEGAWPRNTTLRKNRWHEKQFAQLGELEWRFLSGRDWGPDAFDTLAGIEAASWIAADTDGQDAKFLAPHNRRFWEKAAQDPHIAAMMSAAILSIGGRPVAFSFDLDVGRVKYAIANSYDRLFAKNSPGKVLYYRNLIHSMEKRGTRFVDWGAGDKGHKRTIGAERGPEILDLLFVRSRALAALLRPLWRRSGVR